MTAVIKAEGLSKRYIIDHEARSSYGTLRDALAESARRWGRRALQSFSGRTLHIADATREEFWALRDVSFEVKQGDRIGIIGRNGAGKSTLLKILSRITEPTQGRVRIQGRVASLLEVGTGFHPELTGRENIRLNGAVLGMKKTEIRKKFDEIIAFAEVERFLDTPVKRYSSGMYLRLAFAVAAHLDPEILIVDEVLAVGDVNFQAKCIGKMESIGKEGRTLLFVSHNMGAIERICGTVMLLEDGAVKAISADVTSVVRGYLATSVSVDGSEWVRQQGYRSDACFVPLRFAVVDRTGARLDMPVRHCGEAWIRVDGEIREANPLLCIGYAIYGEGGDLLFWSYQNDSDEQAWPKVEVGRCALMSRLPTEILNEGSYRIELIASLFNQQWIFEPGVNAPSIIFDIQGGFGHSPYWIARRPGLLAPRIGWTSD